MSDSGFKKVGRPDANVDGGFIFFMYCGGKGGGGCLFPLGTKSIVLEYKMPRFIVRNRRIIFENKEFYGVRIFNDAGAAGFCDHSLGTEKGFYMALSGDGNLPEDQIKVQGKFISGALPMEIEFLAKEIPQPVELTWDNSIFVHLFWEDVNYLNEGGVITEDSFRIKKHDYDIQL